MPAASDFQRDDCLVGDKRRTYAALLREWRCEDCGGRLVRQFGEFISGHVGYYVTCGRCTGQNFIHENELLRQQAEAREVLAGLPPELAEMLKGA